MKEYKTKIVKIIEESASVKRFVLDLSLDFVPGQYVMVSIPGFVNDSDVLIKRSFSIASAPGDAVELCIAKTGEFSTKMFSVSEGQELTVFGPMGKFVLSETVSPGTIFIALGTGIAPIMSMLRSLNEKMVLLFGIRTSDDYLYKDEIESMNLDLKTCISSGDTGRVTAHMDDLDSSKDVYICGKPEAVDEIRDKLVSLGFSKDRIFREKW